MHCGCLGVTGYSVAHSLFEVFQFIGGLVTVNVTKKMGELTLLIKVAAKASGLDESPVGYPSLPMIKAQGKNPTMKTKAFETR